MSRKLYFKKSLLLTTLFFLISFSTQSSVSDVWNSIKDAFGGYDMCLLYPKNQNTELKFAFPDENRNIPDPNTIHDILYFKYDMKTQESKIKRLWLS